MEGKEAVAKAPEEALDLALGGAVAHRSVGEQDAQVQAGQGDFCCELGSYDQKPSRNGLTVELCITRWGKPGSSRACWPKVSTAIEN